jgi:hypothetical protein
MEVREEMGCVPVVETMAWRMTRRCSSLVITDKAVGLFQDERRFKWTLKWTNKRQVL